MGFPIGFPLGSQGKDMVRLGFPTKTTRNPPSWVRPQVEVCHCGVAFGVAQLDDFVGVAADLGQPAGYGFNII